MHVTGLEYFCHEEVNLSWTVDSMAEEGIPLELLVLPAHIIS